VRRVRTRSDRRLSVTRITPKGAELVARIEPVLEDYRQKMAPALSAAEWKELGRLCERLTGGREHPSS
jgi:DNA-binding MarR family transcriptional regulator